MKKGDSIAMQKQRSLTANFIMNTILSISSFVFPLLTFPYISRILQPAGIGKISFATSVVSYFAMFAQMGIPTYGIRACAKVRDDREELSRTVHELFFINLGMSLVSYVALFFVIFYIPRLRQEKELFLIISLTIILNTVGMEWVYKASERYTYITVRSIVFKFIAFVAMFLLVHGQDDYICYGAITIFAASASNIFNLIHLHKMVILRPLRPYCMGRHFKAIITFFAMSCATVIYTNLDTVMLGFMKSDTDVGYYNAAVKVKTILVSVVTSLGAVLLPRVSYYIEHGLFEAFQTIASKATDFVLVIAVPLCVYFMLFSEESIYFLSGEAYADAVIPMCIIMPTLILIGLTNIMGIQMLVPMGKEKLVLYSEMAGAVVDIILNAFLIPEFAAAGAALGTLVAEMVVWGVQFYFLRARVRQIYSQMRYRVFIGALLTGVVVSLWVKWMGWRLFMTLTISACLFFGGYLLFLYKTKEPVILEIKDKLIKVLIKKRKE